MASQFDHHDHTIETTPADFADAAVECGLATTGETAAQAGYPVECGILGSDTDAPWTRDVFHRRSLTGWWQLAIPTDVLTTRGAIDRLEVHFVVEAAPL
jgi:hypothetical protein